MSNATYNGWTNYETWAVNLWLDNDEGSQDFWREQAQECWDEAAPTSYSTREENAVRHLSDRLKDYHEEARPEVDGMYGDLIDAALGAVNWREIAKHYVEDFVDKSSDE